MLILICLLNSRILGYDKITIITISNAGREKPTWGEARRGGLSKARKNCHPYYWLLFGIVIRLFTSCKSLTNEAHDIWPLLGFEFIFSKLWTYVWPIKKFGIQQRDNDMCVEDC